MMPRVVAVVGASRDRRKFGNKAVRVSRNQGYTVIPINPRGGKIEGLTAYASILDVPGPIQIATIYVQPHIGPDVMTEVARKGIEEV